MDLQAITKPGIHLITHPIPLPDGTHLQGEKGARLVGSIRLSGFFRKDGTEGVYVCDLSAMGVRPAPMVSRGFGRKISPSHSELFINGRPLSISQFPKKGSFLTITELGEVGYNEWERPCGILESGFFYKSDRPKSWQEGQQIWVHGYWAYDWSPTRECIALLDKDLGFIRTLPPYGQNAFTKGQRFYFFNVLEEVTEPGDYCIDYTNNLLYFKPYEDTGPLDEAEVFLSSCDQPVFRLDHARDISIDGFVIEAFRGNAISVSHSSQIVISNCTIRNIGNRAVCVDDSQDVKVEGCHIHDTGDGGIAFYCGDRRTLEPAGCSVSGCHIHHVANWDRCYEPAIRLYGVGLSACGNLLHDCPHSAVLFGGNDIAVNGNHVHHVVTETGDAGAIYGGRDYTFRGNSVSGNFLHHIGSGVGMGTMGVYNDDCLSGTVMEDNVFFKVQRAIFLGGGVDFVIRNNLFVDCTPCVEVDGRGQSPHKVWRNMVIHTLRDRFYNICGQGISGAEPPYLARYPELKVIDGYYRASEQPRIPPSAAITGNLFCSERKIEYTRKMDDTWCCDGGKFTEADNRSIDRQELYSLLNKEQLAVLIQDETESIGFL